MEDQTAGAWARTIYSGDWTTVFHRLAREKYARVVDHRELAEDARQKLAIRLAALGERDQVRLLRRGYVFVAFKRALVDAFREIMGRHEPRKWLEDLGVLGERLFDLYCLMRLRLDEILAILREDSELVGIEAIADADIRAVIAEMDRQRECDGHARETVALDAEPSGRDRPLDIAARGADPAEVIEQTHAEALRLMLFGGPPQTLPEPLRQRLARALVAADGRPLLGDDELFILRCLRDGITERRVGELLGGWSVRQVRYRREKTIDKLREALHGAGLDAEDFQ